MRVRPVVTTVALALAATGVGGAAVALRGPARDDASPHHQAVRAGASVIHPLALHRGPGPRARVLEDDVLLTPRGPITLRFPGHAANPVLMGKVGTRFVVGVDRRGGTQFWSVPRHGSATRLGTPRSYYDYSPSMGAGRILVSYSDRGTGRTTMTQVDARTGRTLHVLKGFTLIPLSIGAKGVALAVGGTSNSVKVWGLDGVVRPLFSTGSELLVPSYVGLDRGLVVNEDIHHDVYRADVTDLAAPRATRWSTPEGPLLGVSPSGRYVVLIPPTADGTDSQRAIDVRRLSDGALVHRFRFDRYPASLRVAFEDETTFLATIEAGHGRTVLVRCTVSGHCERASGAHRVLQLESRGEY